MSESLIVFFWCTVFLPRKVCKLYPSAVTWISLWAFWKTSGQITANPFKTAFMKTTKHLQPKVSRILNTGGHARTSPLAFRVFTKMTLQGVTSSTFGCFGTFGYFWRAGKKNLIYGILSRRQSKACLISQSTAP